MQDGHQIPLRWEYFLDAHRVDAFHRLKMSQYFLDMQAIAMRHAEELGVGFAALARKSIAWVLTRMLVEVHHMPKLGETYTLSTWANTPNRMLYPRFFRLADASGREAVTASSLWVLIDTEKRRMARPDKADVDMPELGAPAGAYPLPEKLHAPERFDGSLQRRAAYSDFDLNGHMNNARYIEWILDGLPRRARHFAYAGKLCPRNIPKRRGHDGASTNGRSVLLPHYRTGHGAFRSALLVRIKGRGGLDLRAPFPAVAKAALFSYNTLRADDGKGAMRPRFAHREQSGGME